MNSQTKTTKAGDLLTIGSDNVIPNITRNPKAFIEDDHYLALIQRVGLLPEPRQTQVLDLLLSARESLTYEEAAILYKEMINAKRG